MDHVYEEVEVGRTRSTPGTPKPSYENEGAVAREQVRQEGPKQSLEGLMGLGEDFRLKPRLWNTICLRSHTGRDSQRGLRWRMSDQTRAGHPSSCKGDMVWSTVGALELEQKIELL